MAVTLNELAQRLGLLETEVRVLQDQVRQARGGDAPLEMANRWLRESRVSKSFSSPALEGMFQRIAASVKPIGAEKLQEMMIADGINPEECIFSREILAMRDE